MGREVPRADWVEALERFSREHRAWLARVNGGDEHPLRQVGFEAPGRMAIYFADDAPEVVVAGPQAVRIDDSGLEIESPQGLARLRFRVNAPPGALDGLAPAER